MRERDRGLWGRGGFEVDMAREKGKLRDARVRSTSGNPCRVRYGDRSVELPTRQGEAYELETILELPG